MQKESKKKKKLLSLFSLFLFLFILNFVSSTSFGFRSMGFVSSIVSGETDLPPVARGNCVNLYQSCSDCTYVNLTSIIFPNGTVISYNEEMNKDDTSFTYNFCSTNELGIYIYSVKGNPSGLISTDDFTFEVTPSGQSGTANTIFFLFSIILLYTITFIGFFGKNIPMTILGGMALLFLGIYLLQNGLIIFQNTLTNYIAYITIAVGIITSFWALLEQFEVI